MTLTSHDVEPFYISTFEWNEALDLASRRRDGILLYGWDRAEQEALFTDAFAGVDEHLLSVISQLKDAFSFAWGQIMIAGDVRALAAALTQAQASEAEAAPDFLPQLLGFLNACARRRQDIKMEQ